jgi:hypothetical protein
MTAEDLPVLDMGNYSPVFADHLVVEENGPVYHLIFCATQKVGDERRAVVVDRVVVPAALLPVFARQLANPAAAGDTAWPEERTAH